MLIFGKTYSYQLIVVLSRILVMTGNYNLSLVILAFAIACLASYTALDLAGRVKTSSGRPRFLWLFGGATAMGSGIWSMHFVAMLALKLPISVNYNVSS